MREKFQKCMENLNLICLKWFEGENILIKLLALGWTLFFEKYYNINTKVVSKYSLAKIQISST